MLSTSANLAILGLTLISDGMRSSPAEAPGLAPARPPGWLPAETSANGWLAAGAEDACGVAAPNVKPVDAPAEGPAAAAEAPKPMLGAEDAGVEVAAPGGRALAVTEYSGQHAGGPAHW